MNLPYTKRNRLADVLRLIMGLALDKQVRSRVVGYKALDKSIGSPLSASNWLTIAEEHREIFAVENAAKGSEIYIFLRDRNVASETLPPDIIIELINKAVKEYDRQKSEKLK